MNLIWLRSNQSVKESLKPCESIFWYAAGRVNTDGLANTGSNGRYWSSTINDAANAYNLNFDSSNINPANNNNRYNGYSVRCVAYSDPTLISSTTELILSF